MNVEEIASKFNDPRLKKAIGDLAQSPKGQQVLKKLDTVDKRKLESMAQNINGNKISTEMLLQQIKSNPQVLDKLNSIISKM